MEFTFPIAMLHIYELYTCHGGEADQFCGLVCMLPFLLYQCFKRKEGSLIITAISILLRKIAR